jgi:hypothetical protein
MPNETVLVRACEDTNDEQEYIVAAGMPVGRRAKQIIHLYRVVPKDLAERYDRLFDELEAARRDIATIYRTTPPPTL